jgi:hypothetical protein
VLDEQRVEGDPVSLRYRIAERGLRLLGRPCPHHAQTVGDAVHVGIDGDRRDTVAEDQDAVRRLRANAPDRGELLERPGNRTPESVEQFGGAGPNDPGLHPVEPGRADQRLDLGRFRSGEGGRVREPSEQPGARHVGVRVARPLGEDRSDQHLERVLGVVAQIRTPPVAGAVERAEAVEDRLPVDRVDRPRPGHPRPPGRALRVRASVGEAETPGSERSGSSESAGSSSPMR